MPTVPEILASAVERALGAPATRARDEELSLGSWMPPVDIVEEKDKIETKNPVMRPWVFNRPTDVTWSTDGSIFVSDGYNNSRVAKFDKNGNWVKALGERGAAPDQFNTPHGITSDNAGNIYVADRGNRRIQVIDPVQNKFVRTITVDVPYPADAKPWMGATPTPEQGLAQGRGGPRLQAGHAPGVEQEAAVALQPLRLDVEVARRVVGAGEHGQLDLLHGAHGQGARAARGALSIALDRTAPPRSGEGDAMRALSHGAEEDIEISQARRT